MPALDEPLWAFSTAVVKNRPRRVLHVEQGDTEGPSVGHQAAAWAPAAVDLGGAREGAVGDVEGEVRERGGGRRAAGVAAVGSRSAVCGGVVDTVQPPLVLTDLHWTINSSWQASHLAPLRRNPQGRVFLQLDGEQMDKLPSPSARRMFRPPRHNIVQADGVKMKWGALTVSFDHFRSRIHSNVMIVVGVTLSVVVLILVVYLVRTRILGL